jgi:hypothetical protein
MFRIDERGRSILSENNQPVVGSFEHYAVKGNFFTPMICIRKSAYLAIGGMSEIPRFQDRYFMLKCLQANYKVDCLDTPLHIMYEHGANRISSVGAQKSKLAFPLMRNGMQLQEGQNTCYFHGNLIFLLIETLLS